MAWELAPISTYPKAQRKETYRRLASVMKGSRRKNLLDLEDVRERLGLVQQSYVGVRPIPVKSIVGSVARSNDFDTDFLPTGQHVRARWERLERAFPNSDFPPITVYKVKEAYFVVDGHHRVAIARQRKLDFLDAEITELHTSIDITPGMDFAEVLHLEQERRFHALSGLNLVRPDANIHFTRPEGYPELMEHVKVHGYNLMQEEKQVMPPHKISAHWYDTVYRPAVESFRREGLREILPRATEGDLFLWVHERQRRMFPERGFLPFDQLAQEAKAEEGKKLGVRAKAAVDKVEDAIDSAAGAMKRTFALDVDAIEDDSLEDAGSAGEDVETGDPPARRG